MRVLSLFSGIGAFEKALTNLKQVFELVGFSEIDKYAVKSYCAIHGVSDSLNLGDITKINELPSNIDLITYGFPCQDLSIAGKQVGFQGNRSSLFFEALRLIKLAKPNYAIAENVKNLTSKKFKNEFELVLKSLEEAGYTNYWQVLNAKDYGIPQNRERVFIISIRNDIRQDFEFPIKEELKIRLKDLLEDEVEEKYYILKPSVLKNIARDKEEIKQSNKDIFQCKCKSGFQDNKVGIKVSPTIRANNPITHCLEVGKLDIRGYDQIKRIYSSDGLSPTLSTMQGGNREPKILDDRIRKLTPLECWRLMGFSDDDFNKAKQVCSNSQLYKQAGNSICVNVLEKIFNKLLIK